jgi:Flp pilus assembly protein TadG
MAGKSRFSRRGILRERRAATAVMFALTVTPILAAVALAVDVGFAVRARARLDLAANAAALTAVTTAANAYAADPTTSFQPAQDAGSARFQAQAGALAGVSIASAAVTVARTGGTIAATAAYTATFTTYFAGLFGFTTLPVDGTATMSRALSPFMDFQFLLDNSSSMAIPSTQAGITQLGQLVRQSPLFAQWGQNQNCAFGCHFDAGGNDFFGLAHRNNIQLRIDVLAQAVGNVIGTIEQSPLASQFQAGLYTFNKTVSTVLPLTSNLAAAATAASAITLPVTTQGGDADTNQPSALATMASTLPAGGDGSTPATARQFLFIITDGVEDYINSSGTRVIKAFDPTTCTALKANGVQVLTLYTTYIPLPTNAFYNQNVAPFIGSVAPNLQACASRPDYAFQASDPASIDAALQAMLQAALASPARLTQ